MLNSWNDATKRASLAPGEVPITVLFGSQEIDPWVYRSRTMALLKRYARASVEVGRLPALLGREIFRSHVTSYSMSSFEDVVIFVTDIERCIDHLTDLDKKILAMHVFEEYTIAEVSHLLVFPQRTIERQLQSALDTLSLILVEGGMLK